MASSNSFFSSSPTVVLPPNQPGQYFGTNAFPNATKNGQPTNSFTNPFTPGDASMSIATTPGSLAGRKRSRGDTDAPEEEAEGMEDGLVDASRANALAKMRGKPVYGPGMTLVYPEDPSYSAIAESQSGTWLEEDSLHNSSNHVKRPSITARKSQRKDATSSEPDNLAQLVLPPQMRDVTAEPLIDEATRVLGISWTRMDSREALQISQAAYAKWIQNHYSSLKDVSVWFENSAIPGYLVQAQNAYSNQQEYYIFSHDLTEAKLVTNDPTQLVPRLQMLPALELAAPGGTIRADPDPITASQNEVNGVLEARPTTSEGDFSFSGSLMHSFCSAHEMEMDDM